MNKLQRLLLSYCRYNKKLDIEHFKTFLSKQYGVAEHSLLTDYFFNQKDVVDLHMQTGTSIEELACTIRDVVKDYFKVLQCA